MNNLIKKLLVAILMLGFVIPFAIAEDEKSSSKDATKDGNTAGKFKPVFEFNITPVDVDQTYNTETKETKGSGNNVKGNVSLGVAIQATSLISLTPYAKYETWDLFDNSCYGRIYAGLNAKFSFTENMYLLADLAYKGDLSTSLDLQGFDIALGMHYALPSAFLSLDISDTFGFVLKTYDKIDKKINYNSAVNTLNAAVVFNFFQFFMPEVEAGIYTDFNLRSFFSKDHIQEDPSLLYRYRSNEFNFNFGFIAKPLDFLTIKTGLWVYAYSSKDKTGSADYSDLYKSQRVGMPISAIVEFGKANIALDYRLRFYEKKNDVKTEDEIENNIKLSFGYKY